MHGYQALFKLSFSYLYDTSQGVERHANSYFAIRNLKKQRKSSEIIQSLVKFVLGIGYKT